jgi:Na+-transporting NADH:ubiquinone oxidoreductase, subunit NqrA
MAETIKTSRGVDIKLQGQAEQLYDQFDAPKTYALKPDDFPGIRLKLKVKEGDEVQAGDPIFFDRDREGITIPAPVSGEVVEIVRGPKRKILEVRILADTECQYRDFGAAKPEALDREAIVEKLTQSGAWAFIRQRPYNIIASPSAEPRDIFVSCFDSAPLAPDSDFVVHGREEDFHAGLAALMKLTQGKLYLGVDALTNPSPAFKGVKGVELRKFKGPHPVGNVWVQIHHVKPINKGEQVWTVHYQDVFGYRHPFPGRNF